MENTEKRFSKPQDIELEFTQIENHTHTHTHTHTHKNRASETWEAITKDLIFVSLDKEKRMVFKRNLNP